MREQPVFPVRLCRKRPSRYVKSKARGKQASGNVLAKLASLAVRPATQRIRELGYRLIYAENRRLCRPKSEQNLMRSAVKD